MEFKAFGEAISVTGTITNNLRFPGQYFDEETGLHYNYFRDYNPVIGRYVQADPIGIKEGQNHLYSYVENKPVNLADPKGLDVYPPPGDEEEIIIDWPEIIDSPCKRRCYTIAQLHHLCKLIPAAGYACTPVGWLFARACIQSFCECNDLTMPDDFTGS